MALALSKLCSNVERLAWEDGGAWDLSPKTMAPANIRTISMAAITATYFFELSAGTSFCFAAEALRCLRGSAFSFLSESFFDARKTPYCLDIACFSIVLR